jgi:hypothetical protein
MPPVASAAWRALILLLQSVAPWALPLAVLPRPSTRHPLAADLASAAGLAALLALSVWWLARARRNAAGALLALATLGAAAVCALRFPTARWPLGAGVLVVGPLLWLTLLAAARTVGNARARGALTALWFVALMAEAFASRGALRRALRAPAPVEAAPEEDVPDATVPLADAAQTD